MFLDKFHLLPDDVLMIGDAPPDILAARETGVHIASVVWDSYAKDEVIAMNPDYIFYTAEELQQFIYVGDRN